MPTRVIFPAPHAALEIEEYEPNAPQNGQLKVELRATSLNPLDWKRIKKNLFIPNYPHVLGMDIAGIVVDKGTSFKYEVGDKIMGVGSPGWSDGGSFQSYVLIHERDTCKIPDSVSFTDAATVPFALSTAFCALFLNLDLTLPTDAASGNNGTVLVWGGSGSVGGYAVQLAKISGYRVIATSSAQSVQYVKTLGADVVFDAAETDVIEKIKTAAPDIGVVFDTVVTDESVDNCIASLKGGKGVVCTAIMYKDSKNRTDVKFSSVFSGNLQGKIMGPGEHAEGLKLGEYLWEHLPSFLKAGKIRAVRHKVLGGLDKIPEGLKELEKGSRFKLIISV